MTEWWLQWWIGLFLMVSGFSMGRMGPAFNRAKIGYPLALFGLGLVFFSSDEGLIQNEQIASETMRQTLYWAVPGLIGCFIVARGSPIYNVTRPPTLAIGWAVLLLSWYILLTHYDPFGHDLISSIITIAGLIIVFIVHMFAIRLVETLPRSDETIPPLSETEKTYVASVLNRHLENKGD
ncbi:MAG: hypothetical protein QGI73_01865 [Candidatus Thalassarchaeaceae archaeon]|jgi:hypothetical protein|nr:hypothetical protein [Candidatus Thalassarchaeaceae archaeon]|tara:strand:- start:444 stop:983 length:540 start_codon:yes stop_codon:yes gene_type:complete